MTGSPEYIDSTKVFLEVALNINLFDRYAYDSLNVEDCLTKFIIITKFINVEWCGNITNRQPIGKEFECVREIRCLLDC
jgi:hypothetical protein